MMTHKEYYEALGRKAKELKSSGGAPPIIQRHNGTYETQEWTAWQKYWTAIGARASLELTAGRSQFTVPTMLPWEFDIDYNG